MIREPANHDGCHGTLSPEARSQAKAKRGPKRLYRVTGPGFDRKIRARSAESACRIASLAERETAAYATHYFAVLQDTRETTPDTRPGA